MLQLNEVVIAGAHFAVNNTAANIHSKYTLNTYMNVNLNNI